MLNKQLQGFIVVGGIGFLVDAGVLTLLVKTTELGPFYGRAVSFAAAVTVTWLLNRTYVFGCAVQDRSSSEYAAYVTVQVVGAAINLAVYAFIIATVPRFGAAPVIPLAAGAAAALVFNYVATSRLVYTRDD